MTPFAKMKRAVIGGRDTAADLRDRIPAQEAEVEQTRAALRDAEEARVAALLDPDEAAVDRADEVIRVARKRHDRAAAMLADLMRRADQAEKAEAEAVRRKRRDEAVKARDAVLARAEADYVAPARRILKFMTDLAEVEATIAEANRDLPEGADPLAPVEAGRATEPVEERVLSQREVRLWTFPGSTDPLDDETAALVEEHADGGVIRSGGRAHPVVRRRFMRIEVEERRQRQWPDALASSISLPGWRAGDPPIWSPARSADPEAVIAHAARLADIARAEPQPPQISVRYELI